MKKFDILEIKVVADRKKKLYLWNLHYLLMNLG